MPETALDPEVPIKLLPLVSQSHLQILLIWDCLHRQPRPKGTSQGKAEEEEESQPYSWSSLQVKDWEKGEEPEEPEE